MVSNRMMQVFQASQYHPDREGERMPQSLLRLTPANQAEKLPAAPPSQYTLGQAHVYTLTCCASWANQAV